jgi:hypothetical protein
MSSPEPELLESDAACCAAIATPALGVQDTSAEARPPTTPRLIRKKSGDIVRPILHQTDRRRHSSAPPGHTPKTVHFDNFQDVEVRPFYCTEEPISINREKRTWVAEGTSEQPTSHRKKSSHWELLQINFDLGSGHRKCQPVYFMHVQLSEAQTGLLGLVGVKNTAFEKQVSCVFSLDGWRTVSRVDAKYQPTLLNRSASLDVDFFTFTVDLADIVELGSKTFRCCIRGVVGGQEFWDNNQGVNYELGFVWQVTRPAEVARLSQADVTARQRERSDEKETPSDDDLSNYTSDTSLVSSSSYLDSEEYSSDDLEGDSSR